MSIVLVILRLLGVIAICITAYILNKTHKERIKNLSFDENFIKHEDNNTGYFMNKKFNFKILFIVLIIIFLFFIIWNRYRFIPHSPMEDLEYKQTILKDSKNITYTIEALRPLMGPSELTKFIQMNNNNPNVYTPSDKNIEEGIFRANLHAHTVNSDGDPTVEKRMNDAQDYASKNIKDGYMVLAITDHNTVLGAKDVIRVLEKNKGKYNNIKMVSGMEIYSAYHNSKHTDEPVQIHVLLWCINPYDKFLNKEFYKANLYDKWNRTQPDRDFDWVISTMSKYGIVGIGHPARYTTYMKEKKYPYMTEMLTRYKSLTTNTPFAEGYYQSYPVTSTGPHLGDEYDKYINHIISEAKRLGINCTGSTDAHGDSIFKFR